MFTLCYAHAWLEKERCHQWIPQYHNSLWQQVNKEQVVYFNWVDQGIWMRPTGSGYLKKLVERKKSSACCCYRRRHKSLIWNIEIFNTVCSHHSPRLNFHSILILHVIPQCLIYKREKFQTNISNYNNKGNNNILNLTTQL